MNELIQSMQKHVKDRRTLRANKRQQINSGVNVFTESKSAVIPVKDLTGAFQKK
jgi:hypothetical protein